MQLMNQPETSHLSLTTDVVCGGACGRAVAGYEAQRRYRLMVGAYQ